MVIALGVLAAAVGPLSSDADATHFRYGHVHATPGQQPNEMRFVVQTAWRLGPQASSCIDPNTGQPIPCSGPAGMAAVGDIVTSSPAGLPSFAFGDGTDTPPRYLVTSISPVYPEGENWYFGVMVDQTKFPDIVPNVSHVYSEPGLYLAGFIGCCRISPANPPNRHVNNPDWKFRVHAVINVGDGVATAVALVPPIVSCPMNEVCTFPIAATNAPGTRLNFRLAINPEAGTNFQQPGPPHAPHAMAIDPETGIVTWNTNGATPFAHGGSCVESCGGFSPDGCSCSSQCITQDNCCHDVCDHCPEVCAEWVVLYSVQVAIESLDAEDNVMSKVAVDFFIRLTPTVGSPPEFVEGPCGKFDFVLLGDSFDFTVTAVDPDVGDTVTLNAIGMPAGAVMTPQLPTQGNPVTADFSWTPTANQVGPHILTMTAVDQLGQSAMPCSVTIFVVDGVPHRCDWFPPPPCVPIWDEVGWDHAPGQPGLDWLVRAMTEHNGDLIVGGQFTNAGGQTVNRIARWDGQSWHPFVMNSIIGVSGTVWALAEYNGDLIVGGDFSQAGGVTVNNIARWDGEQWHPLGGGTNSVVHALTEYNGDLIAAGSFITAGGQTVNRIARWDGSNWHAFGDQCPGTWQEGCGMNMRLLSLAVYEGDLIAGGAATVAGGVTVNGIARWDGQQWQALGSGVSGFPTRDVNALIAHDGDLIAGGAFTGAGGQTVNRIALWDGENWHPFVDDGAVGMTWGAVFDFEEYHGHLIAAGTFLEAGGREFNRIARWDGVRWWGMNQSCIDDCGTNGGVEAIALRDGKLFVGGNFTAAGGSTADYIATYESNGILRCPETFHVPGDYPTIQQAIDDAMDYDKFLIAPGTYNEAINFLGKAVHLIGLDGPKYTIIDATGLNARAVTAESGEGPCAILEGLTITGGVALGKDFPDNAGGGMYLEEHGPTLINCHFVGNIAEYGGGLYVDSGVPSVDGCVFFNNHATNEGGGIYVNKHGPTAIGDTSFCMNSPDNITGPWGDFGGNVFNPLGDLNCDGVVNVADLLILFDNWGDCANCNPDAPGNCPGDFNNDCTVNVSDLLILFDNWG